MRLISRNDLFLLLGLTLALFAIFSGPLGRVLDFAYEMDRSRGLQLLPGLVILAVVFMFHQVRKRHQTRIEALAAAAEARQAARKAAEMERLVSFSQALARSLEAESIRRAAIEHLQTLAGDRPAWAMTWRNGQWQPLTPPDEWTPDRELAARRALGQAPPAVTTVQRDLCFPMVVGATPIGVIGALNEPPLLERQRTVLEAAAALLAMSLKNAELFAEVHESSVRDALTGCFVRRHALEVIDVELRRARRTGLTLSLVMFDVDHFKEINDRYGHLCGDAVLAAVGRRMHVVLRGSDLKCRYGGEEFLILLPDTPLSGARHVAETLRREFAEHPVHWNGIDVSFTASFGIAQVEKGAGDAGAFIGRADTALYQAKQDGRNCVRAAAEPAII